MSKNRTKELLKISDLVKASGVRYSTIKYYSEIGILPYDQKDDRLMRRYDKQRSLQRLKEIQRLKNKRLSIDEIKRHFRK